MKSALWLLVLAACGESAADRMPESFAKPPPSAVTVELASVTLGDDCAPVAPPATSKPPASPPVTPAMPAKHAPGAAAYRSCDQTTMQLAIRVPASFKGGAVRIKKVELLDTDGKLLQPLAARNPRAWKNTTSYQPWDEKLAAGLGTNAMYDLTAPDWDKLTKGRWNAHTRSFQVRVVVEIAGSNKTVTKSAITPTRLPPPVPT